MQVIGTSTGKEYDVSRTSTSVSGLNNMQHKYEAGTKAYSEQKITVDVVDINDNSEFVGPPAPQTTSNDRNQTDFVGPKPSKYHLLCPYIYYHNKSQF